MLSDALAATGPTPARVLSRVKQSALANSFVPRGTVWCRGPALFRTKAARDAACLLDLDNSILAWTCLPEVLVRNRRSHIPDFAVERRSGTAIVDVVPLVGPPPPKWALDAAGKRGVEVARWSS